MTPVRREELAFVDAAPVTFSVYRDFAVPPERLFDALADAPGWATWVSIVRRATWTSEPQGGVGSTRRLTLRGGVVLDEEFVVWERPHRWGFVIIGSNVPTFRAAVEVAELEGSADGGTHLRYRGGAEFVAGLRPFNRILTLILPEILDRSLAQLNRQLRQP
jgi:uncharacterized protein YndB with AHSA1/START domain